MRLAPTSTDEILRQQVLQREARLFPSTPWSDSEVSDDALEPFFQCGFETAKEDQQEWSNTFPQPWQQGPLMDLDNEYRTSA